jgi:hypothetical protein
MATRTAKRTGVTLTFDFERETKNTCRYAEVTADGATPVIGTLYLNKVYADSNGDIMPDSVTVTINAS